MAITGTILKQGFFNGDRSATNYPWIGGGIGTAWLNIDYTLDNTLFTVNKIYFTNIEFNNGYEGWGGGQHRVVIGYSYIKLQQDGNESISYNIIPLTEDISGNRINYITLKSDAAVSNENYNYLKDSNNNNFTTNFTIPVVNGGNYKAIFNSQTPITGSNNIETRFWMPNPNFGLLFYMDDPISDLISLFPSSTQSSNPTDTESGVYTDQFITATKIQSLKQYIKAVAAHRTQEIQEGTTKLKVSNIIPNSWNPVIQEGQKIYNTDLGDILNKALIINDFNNLKTSKQHEKILYNGVQASKDILDFFYSHRNDTNQNMTSTTSNHGCRGACLGLCAGGCGGSSMGSGQGCSSLCSGKCGSNCGDACVISNSDKTCAGECTGKCYNGCVGNCRAACGGCGTGCYYGCSVACVTNCKNGCAINCTGGCYGCTASCINSSQ